jgi:hypothetical protein
MGECTKDDIEEIHKLVLLKGHCNKLDFTNAPWDNATLVTTQNGSRVYWNKKKLEMHCQQSRNILYTVYTNNTINQELLTNLQCFVVAGLKSEKTGHLPNKVQITVGMKAMVLLNIDMDADLANRSRGVIKDIILDPCKLTCTDEGMEVCLSYPPAVILFKPLYGRKNTIPGLPHGVIPIFPSWKSFSLTSFKKTVVDREQFALTGGYAFTDYKAQGQTLESVVIDIGKPPSRRLSAFNVYVALSRGQGRSTIQLLQDFDEKLFTKHPSSELEKEDGRLDKLAKATHKRFKLSEFRANLSHTN